MFNYNVANPVNIRYRNYPQNQGARRTGDEEKKEANQTPLNPDSEGRSNRFPNGSKVAIDYTKNQINIAQVLQDFRSTIAAINSPDDVKEEVESYLELAAKETFKKDPSREIVLANLKNAARVTDKYIQESLKKPSKVVQDWVEALFLQKINLKPDPNEINEEFKVKIPPKKNFPKSAYIPPKSASAPSGVNSSAAINAYQPSYIAQNNVNELQFAPFEPPIEPEIISKDDIKQTQETENTQNTPFISTSGSLNEVSPSDIVPSEYTAPVPLKSEVDPKEASSYIAKTENEAKAREILGRAKTFYNNGGDLYNTLKLYDEAIELIQGSSNINLKSAIYFERGKVFDSYDFAELALIDYHKATNCKDGNLKAQANIKMGNIYDDYARFEPAMDRYSRAIESSEEVNNIQGKTRALRYIASMFSRIYDAENTQNFCDLALESAVESGNPKTIANTYLEVADNYKYIGEDSKALKTYSALAQNTEVKEDYETLAKNYTEASILMDKKGNKQKSYALMLKAKEYQRLARLQKSG